jgi:hypothetical protein
MTLTEKQEKHCLRPDLHFETSQRLGFIRKIRLFDVQVFFVMRKKSNLFVLLLGFLIGALGYWTADFSEERALYESVYYIKAPGAFLAVLIAGVFRKNQPSWNALMVSFGVMLGMLSRILVDILLDPTSHNLFPFELMIGLVIVLPVCFVGAYLIHGIFYIAGKN